VTALRAAVPVSGGRAWESPYDKAVPIVELAFRQARFAALLTEHGIPTPRTVLSDEIDQAPDGPLVVKPCDYPHRCLLGCAILQLRWSPMRPTRYRQITG
jgi:hypothetical protein